ncbi:terminase small subunit [Echinicola sp. 20G]|uniref:terminase small subunit n=1 Tax=Echinicola sp. 20G TaxID=2781961 RepID=UPI00190FFA09|nr:terminase small subunit [Echinicola sp. 20G]
MKTVIQIESKTIFLTSKEVRFVHHYLSDAKMNATTAAKLAGYSNRTAGQQGYENMKKPEILEYIQFKAKPILQQLEVTREKLLQELANIAFSNIGDVTTPDWTLKDLNEINPDIIGAVKSIRKNNNGYKVTFHDKLAALTLLLKLCNDI